MITAEYLDGLKQRRAVLEAELSDPATAARPGRLKAVMLEYAHLKKLIRTASEFMDLLRDAEESRAILADEAGGDAEWLEMARQALAEAEARLPETEQRLRRALIPPDPMEAKNIIMEIRAGTGGEEAALFAADLFRMYSRYAERKGWKISVLDAAPADAGGYKELVFSVEGEQIFRHFRYESGTHRVQRVPATETQGRIHTSAATVAVLPEAEEVEVDIRPDDLKIDTYRASGAGGQHVNTTDSAVRITHLPSGVVVQCQDERSQHKNRDKCMRMLRARLFDHQQQEQAAQAASMRKSQVGSGDRSEKIRTYNYPQNRLTDHRINLTLYKLDRVVQGELDELLTALREHDTGLRVREQTSAWRIPVAASAEKV